MSMKHRTYTIARHTVCPEPFQQIFFFFFL